MRNRRGVLRRRPAEEAWPSLPIWDMVVPPVLAIGIFVAGWAAVALIFDAGRSVVGTVSWGFGPLVVGLVLAGVREVLRRRDR
ncbi:MAG: hypothetical protein ACJ73S_16025 [Mycobacteriales bacterium]